MCEVLDRIENRGIQKGIEKGIEKGIKKGIEKGEDTILSLMKYLLSNGRMEDARRATEDKAYRSKLLDEISLQK